MSRKLFFFTLYLKKNAYTPKDSFKYGIVDILLINIDGEPWAVDSGDKVCNQRNFLPPAQDADIFLARYDLQPRQVHQRWSTVFMGNSRKTYCWRWKSKEERTNKDNQASWHFDSNVQKTWLNLKCTPLWYHLGDCEVIIASQSNKSWSVWMYS